MQCIITAKQPNQLANCDETKKMALNTQTVRVKEKPHLSHGEPSLGITSGTDSPIKAFMSVSSLSVRPDP